MISGAEELSGFLGTTISSVRNFTTLFRYLGRYRGIIQSIRSLLGIGGVIGVIGGVAYAILDAFEKYENINKKLVLAKV